MEDEIGNYTVKYYNETTQEWLCFFHAVMAIIRDDHMVESLFEEFGSEYDMRNTNCAHCRRGVDA